MMLRTEMWFAFTVACLAVFGMSYSVSQTTGPFALFRLFRESVTKRFPQDWVRVGVSCPICISFWISLPVSCGMMNGDPWLTFLNWMAMVGFVSLVMVLSPPED